MESILTSIKKMLGIAEDSTVFDPDIIMHINSVFMILRQLGVGPSDGFSIEDDITVWTDYVDEIERLEAIKTYIYLKVRLYFDPPASSVVLNSINQRIDELEWRINEERSISEVENDSTGGGGSSSATVDESVVREIVDEALTEAKNNGEFDGPPGPAGKDGVDGIDGKDGIPGPQGDKGEKGDPGEPGPAGVDGYTPQKGVDYFDGERGDKGEKGDPGEIGPQGEKGDPGEQGPAGIDGYTPQKGVDYFDGEQGPQGPQGETGPAGADGYTPVKGTDYWTETDKTEMLDSMKESYFMPYYKDPTSWGCTNDDTLDTIVTTMPNNCESSFWINASQFPAVYTELFNETKKYGLTEAYGNVFLQKRSSATRITWQHYRSCMTLVNNYTSVNNRGWAGWNMATFLRYSLDYRRVNYIESHGTEFINTSFIPNHNTRVILDIEPTTLPSSAWWYGSRTAYEVNTLGVYTTAAPTLRTWFGSKYVDTASLSLNQRLIYDQNKNITTITYSDGTTTTVTNDSESFQGEYPLHLFTINLAGNGSSAMLPAKLYSLKIYDNGTLARDFIPVQFVDEFGLYDRIEGQFYGNENNKGSFTGA